MGDVVVIHDDLPGIGPQEAHDVFEGNRFAHAAAPHDHAGLGTFHREGYAYEHRPAVKGLANVAKLEIVVRSMFGVAAAPRPRPRLAQSHVVLPHTRSASW